MVAHYYILLLSKASLLGDLSQLTILVKWIKPRAAVLEFIDSEEAMIIAIMETCRHLSTNGRFELTLELLKIHNKSSALDFHYTKAQSLFKMRRYGECVACIQASISN